MRFFHIGDLHFGKMLHDIDLTGYDQGFWVDRFLEAADEYLPDAVVIAGDVYDRRIPSPEAMKLFDRLVTGLSRRGIYVFVIPGNHDSDVRLSHVSGLLAGDGIYIAGELKRELDHVTLEKDGIKVCFWLMPYLFPKAVSVKGVLDRDDIQTYDQAARLLLEAQPVDDGICNVLVAHQNVLSGGEAPEHSGSETIIGGLGEIEADAFDRFDYVALGHIHNAQRIGRETVRYSGCPLYYDFSEIGRSKDLTMVTVCGKGDVRVERVPIRMPHTLVQKAGTLSELLEEGRALENKDSVYVQCILRDRHLPPRALEQLRDVYGDCLINIRREIDRTGQQDGQDARRAAAALSIGEQFEQFYLSQNRELPDGVQEALIESVLEQQDRHGGEYFLDFRNVPEAESKEILDSILQKITEE